MKKCALWMSILAFFIFECSEIFACAPCAEKLNLKATMQQADLIVIGQKLSDGPMTGPANSQAGPDWIKIKVMDVLKGESSKQIIKVNSWTGMCPYGIQVGDGNHVLFLAYLENASEDIHYDAVNGGCSIPSYLVENDMVMLDDEKLSMEEFSEKLTKVLTEE